MKNISIVSDIMRECAKLGLAIDPTPDYPIQLHYSENIFTAMYEPNFASVISAEGDTAEEALNALRIKLSQNSSKPS